MNYGLHAKITNEKRKSRINRYSSWIEALRVDGRKDVRKKVLALMEQGQAAWCDMVMVELFSGARGNYDRQKLVELEKEIVNFPITAGVWDQAKRLAVECRQAGKTLPTADLIISACAGVHDVRLEHCDSHFDIVNN